MSHVNANEEFLLRAARLKVLIADDNQMDRLILKTALGKLNCFDITEAEDGQIATVKIDNANELAHPFDLIFVDWKMPRLDGLKLVKTLRGERKSKHIGIIMLTGMADEVMVREALVAGVNDYIIKPIQADVLKEKVIHFIQSREAR